MNEQFPLKRFKPISKCDFCEHSNDELLAAWISISLILGDRLSSGQISADGVARFEAAASFIATAKELRERNAHRSATG